MITNTRISRLCVALGGMAILAGALVSGCGGDEEQNEYAFFSGGESGVYYPTAQTIAGLTNDAAEDFSVAVQTSGGSTENARALGDGRADFALVQSDIAAYAREGVFGFEEPITGIFGLAALYPEHVQVVALADSGIDSLLDLRGKAVGVGAEGSGTEENARQILEAAGMGMADLGRVEHLDAEAAVDALASGEIEAAFFTFGLGTPAIEELAERTPIAFIPVDGEVRQRLLAEYDFYSSGTVPAGAYSGIESDVETVTVTATLVASDDVPDADVEAMLEALFGNLNAFAGGRMDDLTVESGRDGVSLPLHPGAMTFYESQ